jgi:hypothetical protein
MRGRLHMCAITILHIGRLIEMQHIDGAWSIGRDVSTSVRYAAMQCVGIVRIEALAADLTPLQDRLTVASHLWSSCDLPALVVMAGRLLVFVFV